MGGLGFVIVIAAYLAIAVAVVRVLKSTRMRCAAIVGFLLIPTADAITGRLYLEKKCASEGGLKVYRVVENVDGFLMADNMPGEHWLQDYGFRFAEGYVQQDNTVTRIYQVDGKIVQEWNVPSKARFRSRFISAADDDAYLKSEAVVEVIASGEVLARYTGIYFRGGWAERFLSGFSDARGGTTARCDEWRPEVFRQETILGALKPTKQR
jgi:hypothetical protein